MTVTQADLTFLQSEDTGSTGGGVTAVEIVSAVNNNLWPTIDIAEAAAGGTLYRKWFIRNDHVTDTLQKHAVWIAQMAAGTEEVIGIGFNVSGDDDPTRGDLTAFGANAQVALSSSAADTRTAMLAGLNNVGDPVVETVTLAGTSTALSVVTFSDLQAVALSAPGAQTVTIKQGSGGTTRGTIPAGATSTWRWIEAVALASGLKRAALPSGSIEGFWSRLTWDASTPEADPTESVIGVQRL